MTTPRIIRDQINDGDIPSFADINEAFPKHPGISWHIRMAAFGSIPDAIMAHSLLLPRGTPWHIGYDGKASVGPFWGQNQKRDEYADPVEAVCISTTPANAMIIATMDAYISFSGNHDGKP